MRIPNGQFLVSTELECLTSAQNDRGGAALELLFEQMRRLAPTLPGPSGIFNGYGRLYSDVGHLEKAFCECGSPYQLPLIIERQQRLIARAVKQLEQEGVHLLLANNNHSGLFSEGCPIWGAHENYFTEVHPTSFGDTLLPFLVTRIFGGAGAVHYPTGDFWAAVRPIAMELAVGGGTTDSRAIHSTCREEHHVGARRGMYRYHSILGDGHRSQFNCSLQFAATALAIKASIFDRTLPRKLEALGAFPPDEGWVELLRRLTVLTKRGEPPVVDPLVIRTQRVYYESACNFAHRLGELQNIPDWIPRALKDWDETLTALETGDRAFLASRLDAFIKYELYSSIMQQEGIEWSELSRHPKFFHELALIDHSYHEFCNPKSIFQRLEESGLLMHRVGELVEPGSEPEPFVPETQTRATARARFIRESDGMRNLMVNWSNIMDMAHNQILQMDDPFKTELGSWINGNGSTVPEPNEASIQRIVDSAQADYNCGNYYRAYRRLESLASVTSLLHCDPGLLKRYNQLRLWTQVRSGLDHGSQLLAQLYGSQPGDIHALNDFCCAYRFRGLVPDPAIERWVDFGRERFSAQLNRTSAGAAYREHAAVNYLKTGRPEVARELLEASIEPNCFVATESRIQGRILATLGETYRVLGNRERAREMLNRAEDIQTSQRYTGDMADMTFSALAKWETDSERALYWIAQAKEIQEQTTNRMGLARSLTLEARLSSTSPALTDVLYEQLRELQYEVPLLESCPLLKRIVAHWPAWLRGESVAEEQEPFWGV